MVPGVVACATSGRLTTTSSATTGINATKALAIDLDARLGMVQSLLPSASEPARGIEPYPSTF
jgi:hypothetical protein